MIFYFTGTGNSLAAAKMLQQQDEQLISMADANEQKAYELSVSADENVGFVFPVYFYGLPDTVRTFVQNIRFVSKPTYVYALITCGGSIAGAGDLLGQNLKKQGLSLNAVYSVKMPDNYVLLYDVTTQEQEKPILQAAENTLQEIQKKIQLRRYEGAQVGAAAKLQTAAIYPFYDLTRKTSKFYTDEKCIGCGACAAKCPSKAIEMVNGRPKWVKETCDHCLSCLSCNAIQFGKRTVGRYRYQHPDRRKKKQEHQE